MRRLVKRAEAALVGTAVLLALWAEGSRGRWPYYVATLRPNARCHKQGEATQEHAHEVGTKTLTSNVVHKFSLFAAIKSDLSRFVIVIGLRAAVQTTFLHGPHSFQSFVGRASTDSLDNYLMYLSIFYFFDQ
jgi:hypothetical protein